ncbi:MAG: hypothetical protein ACRD06_00880 [Terriglobia bacterium]
MVLIGTWKADLAHSTFHGRLPLKSALMTVTAHGKIITISRDVTTASGAKFHIEYRDPLDGKAVPVIGDPSVFMGQRSAIRTEFRHGRVTGSTQIKVAKDGLSLIASARRTTPEDGHLYVSVIPDLLT